MNTGRNKRKNSKTASKLEKLESDIRLGFLAIIRYIMEEFNCDFNAPMYVDFENLDGDGNADEFFGKFSFYFD